MWHRRSGAEKAKDVAHLATYYWSRLIATAGCWFFWDFGFYGNKVFQSQFVSILTGGSASRNHPLLCAVYLCSAQVCVHSKRTSSRAQTDNELNLTRAL